LFHGDLFAFDAGTTNSDIPFTAVPKCGNQTKWLSALRRYTSGMTFEMNPSKFPLDSNELVLVCACSSKYASNVHSLFFSDAVNDVEAQVCYKLGVICYAFN